MGCIMPTAALLVLIPWPLATASTPADAPAAATSALSVRVFGPQAATLFEFHTVPPTACQSQGHQCSLIGRGSKHGSVTINGTSGVEMAYGLAQYSRTYLLSSFAWNETGGFQVPTPLPQALPQPADTAVITRECAEGEARCYSYVGICFVLLRSRPPC